MSAAQGTIVVGSKSTNAIVSSLTYSFCSISMVLANKTILSKLDFSYPLVLLLLQASTTVALVSIAKQVVPDVVSYPSFQFAIARRMLPVTLVFMAMLLTGFLSLQNLAVPMVTIFKNLTNIIIVIGEWQLHGQKISAGVIASILLMLGGAFAAAQHDLSYNRTGYLWMAANCCASASYALVVRGASKSAGLSQFGMVFYNNVLVLPLLLPAILFLGEWPNVLTSPSLLPDALPSFVACVGFSGAVGFVLNFASFWCVGATSATTYAVLGALNKIPLLLLGTVLFNAQLSRPQMGYIGLSLAGGFLYSYAKFVERQAEQKDSAGKARVLPQYGEVRLPPDTSPGKNGMPLIAMAPRGKAS